VVRGLLSDVVYRDIPGKLCGFFDLDTGQITIAHRLTPRRRRVTVIHESIHRDLNHGPARSLAENSAREVVVERLASRFLISLPELMRVMSQTTDLNLAAAMLDVDLQCLWARLLGLDSSERLIFNVCVLQCLRVRSDLAMSAVSAVMSMSPLS
jgi:Zn-dependent peptidase ImmA (M78 family)